MVELRTHLRPKGQDRISLHLRARAPVPYPTTPNDLAGYWSEWWKRIEKFSFLRELKPHSRGLMDRNWPDAQIPRG